MKYYLVQKKRRGLHISRQPSVVKAAQNVRSRQDYLVEVPDYLSEHEDLLVDYCKCASDRIELGKILADAAEGL